MAKKPYARTFRYSEETRKILDQYDGDFDELVHEAFFRAREAEEKLKELEKRKLKLEMQISRLFIDDSIIKKLTRDLSILSEYTFHLSQSISSDL